MLKSWSIENFKPIVNSGELKLAPVTVLAGRNSSGKSSLLQSILMIAQTLSNQIPNRALLPNGPLVQLGTFEEILSEFSSSRAITVKFEIGFEHEDVGLNLIDLYRSSDYKVVVTFDTASNAHANSSAIEASKVMIENMSLALDIKYEGKDASISRVNGVLAIKKISEEELKRFLGNVTKDGYPSILSYISEKPNYLGEFTLNSQDGYQDVLGPFLVVLSHFLPTDLVQKPKGDINGLGKAFVVPEQGDLGEAVEQITRFFTSQIRYLGPLRAEPGTTQRNFAPSSELDEVGPKGEYAAVVYHRNQLAHIEWYNPQTKQVEQGTLQDALDTWAQYLGVAEQVRTEMAGAMGVTWKVVLKKGQEGRTLPEVGVGLSQVLPILVMGLLSPSNTLLIMEQPELHLHASVQARLGDFFMGLSKCKKQCLIETHSENLVLQLRYHVVQSGGQEESGCMIYFVDQDEKGAAKFEPIEISARGNILNWPDGFFDESMHQEDKITAASIRRRAKLAKND